MVDSNERVVFLAENQAGGAPWYRLAYDSITEETPYAFNKVAQLTSPDKLDASCEPNRGPEGAPLFLLNHWITTDPVPLPSNAARVNAYDPLLERARDCQRLRHHLPNLVAVNFYRAASCSGWSTGSTPALARHVGEPVGVGAGPAGLAAVEPGDPLDVGGLELEVEDLEVLADPLRRDRLREHDVAALDVPAQDHLGGDLPTLSAISVTTGSSRTSPLAIGDHASVAMPCSSS